VSAHHPQKPKLGITLGDPAGIGPEIVANAISRLDADALAQIQIFGPKDAFERACGALAQEFTGSPQLIDCGDATHITPGQPNAASAHSQVAALEEAVRAAAAGDLAGLCTAPISKSQAQGAGFQYPGHTEFLAARLKTENVAMMFSGPRLRVVLATVHMALADVPRLLSAETIVRTTTLALESLRRDFRISSPRVIVLGLNPHAGEGGLFGEEEDTIIRPALHTLLTAHPDVTFHGPVPPDTAFRREADLWVAMYHDQALIPVKLLDFERTVNVTLGLPIIRTSPDHGVAYDIAGTGKADARPFANALALARTLVENKQLTSSPV